MAGMPKHLTREELQKMNAPMPQSLSSGEGEMPKHLTPEEMRGFLGTHNTPGVYGDFLQERGQRLNILREIVKQEDYPGMIIDYNTLLDELSGTSFEGYRGPRMNPFSSREWEEVLTGADGQLMPIASQVLDNLAGRMPGVDYSKTPLSLVHRYEASTMNTREEQENYYKEKGYGVHYDGAGRLILEDGEGNMFPTRGYGKWTPDRLADFGGMYPEIAAVLAATVATRNAGMLVQLGADLLAFNAASGLNDVVQSAYGLNLESYDDILERKYVESGLLTAGHLAGRAVGLGASVLWSPAPRDITASARQVLRDFESLNKNRSERGLPDVPGLPASTFNESALVGRAVGFISKIPGGAGVFKHKTRLLNDAIEEEVEHMVGGLRGGDKEIMSEWLRQRLTILANESIAKRQRDFGIVSAGDTARGTADAMKEGAESALKAFTRTSDEKVQYLKSFVGDEPVFATDNLQAGIRTILQESKHLDPSMSKPWLAATLNTLENTPRMSLDEIWNIKKTLSTMGWGRTEQPIGTISQGQARSLYGRVSDDLMNVSDSELGRVGIQSRAFKRELVDFNDWYKKEHKIFTESESPINQLLRSYLPEDLPQHFLRPNNASGIKLIRETLGDERFADFRAYSMSLIMNPHKTADESLRAMDNLGDDVLTETFGKSAVKDMRGFLLSKKAIETGPVSKFVSDSLQGGKLLSLFSRAENPHDVLKAKAFFGQDSNEWGLIQLSIAENIINRSRTTTKATALKNKDQPHFGVLDGSKMMKILKDEYGDEVARKLFAGTPLHDNLLTLSNILVAAQKGTAESAGGLAGGMFIGGLIMGEWQTAARAAAVSWVAAKTLSSPSTARWLTHAPIGGEGRAGLRAGTETMLWLAGEQGKHASWDLERINIDLDEQAVRAMESMRRFGPPPRVEE